MKRILAAILIILMLSSISISSYAKELVINYDGTNHKYLGIVYKLMVDGKTVKCDIPPVVINKKTLVPVRQVFEGLGAKIKWDSGAQKFFIDYGKIKIEFKANSATAKLDGKIISLESSARLINGRLMIPSSFFGQVKLKTKIVVLPSKSLITIESKVSKPTITPVIKPGKLDNITYSPKTNQCEVSIGVTGYKDVKAFILSKPDRLVIDITNTKLKSDLPNIKVNSNFVTEIRVSQFQTDKVRVVIDVMGKIKYKVFQKDNQLLINLAVDRSNDPGRGGIDRTDHDVDTSEITDPSPTSSPSPSPTSSPSPSPTPLPSPSPSPLPSPYVSPSPYPSSVPGASPVPETGVSPSPSPSPSASAVPNVSFSMRNIKYEIVGDRICISIAKSKLTEGGATLKKFYTESYDDTNNKYVISFPSSCADLDAGIININDAYISSIEILKDQSQTSIIFNSAVKLSYHVFSRSELGDTAITILKPALVGEKLVVIDAGHGGHDSGAVASGVKEKDLNLDIALRLNEFLKSQNVKTYVLRSDDRFLGLYERSGIANKLNATLFVSIHNNAASSGVMGTEVLYYTPDYESSAFTSKMLAQNIQSSLITALGSVDRKIVSRPDLVVLKATTMKAALVEVGFITNEQERANLLDPNYRQKAATAISDGISLSMGMMPVSTTEYSSSDTLIN